MMDPERSSLVSKSKSLTAISKH